MTATRHLAAVHLVSYPVSYGDMLWQMLSLATKLVWVFASPPCLQCWVTLCQQDFAAPQARAHSLLRQKEADLSKAKASVTQQFEAEVAAAEAAAVRAQQQVDQVAACIFSLTAQGTLQRCLQAKPSFRLSQAA